MAGPGNEENKTRPFLACHVDPGMSELDADSTVTVAASRFCVHNNALEWQGAVCFALQS